jgi:hypothetical protein
MNKNIFCLTIIVVIIILIDLVFNFSKRLFRSSEGFSSNDGIHSLINIIDGTIVTIEKVTTDSEDNKYYIPIFDDEQRVLGMDQNNELVIKDKIETYHWKLMPVKDTLFNIGPEFNGYGYNDDEIYLLVDSATNPQYAVQYVNNGLVCVPIQVAVAMTKAKNNIWIKSETPGPSKKLVLRDFTQSYLGPVKYSSEIDDPDKINIKLNIRDENLKQLLNINNDSTTSGTETETEKCDTWLSKDAVKSICPGCV